MNKDEMWSVFVQPLLGGCGTCEYAGKFGPLADTNDCDRDDYDGANPVCVDDWWKESKCIKWKLASCLDEDPEPDKSKYISIREITCMKCKKEDHCEVTFDYTEAGKINAANVTRLPDGWEYRPYGKAGGVAPYCLECLSDNFP